MSTVASGQGTLVAPQVGAGVRQAITVQNTTPIKITCTGHGFLTGDTVEQEGAAVAAANGVFQITRIDANTYSLNGTTASGSGAQGYAVDYELTPATTIPANGDLIDATVTGAALESCINPQPFLYRRMGKWRLYNQYIINGGAIIPPVYSAPWSTNTAFSSASVTPLASTTYTLESMSDTPSIPPVIQVGDMLQFNMCFTALVNNSNGTQHSIAAVGLGLIQGASLLSTAGLPSVLVDAQSTVATAVPCCVSGMTEITASSGGGSFWASNISICIFGRLDLAPASGTFNLDLIGAWTGYINQYRPN